MPNARSKVKTKSGSGLKPKNDPLGKYRAKRDFKSTPEPAPKVKKTHGTRRFCVQKHLASHLHYDLRLEHAGVLVSWAVPKGPSLDPRDKRLAMHVEDHPIDYGTFEGIIPSGYGAGIVMLWDQGTWEPEESFENVGASLAEGELKFRLEGTKLKGSWVLVRTGSGAGGEESRTWLLIKHKDFWAGPVDVVSAAPLSVKTFGDFADILAAEDPGVWDERPPAVGGDAGRLFREIIPLAASLKANPKKPRRRVKKKS